MNRYFADPDHIPHVDPGNHPDDFQQIIAYFMYQKLLLETFCFICSQANRLKASSQPLHVVES